MVGMASCHRVVALLAAVLVTAAGIATPAVARLMEGTRVPSTTSDYAFRIAPDSLALAGDVVTRANSAGQCTEAWLADAPPGSIILGVDPRSCDPADWDGGSAAATLDLVDVFHPTVVVVRLAWPALAGKGLHSPDRNRTATVLLDGRPLLDKRTTDRREFGDYFGTDGSTIQATLVVTRTGRHTLTIVVPPRTAWDLSAITVDAAPMPQAVRGIAYAPYRDCQMPGGAVEPTEHDVHEDMFRLAHTANAVRTYAATGISGRIPAIARGYGLRVYAGAWLDGAATRASDDREIAGLIDLARSGPLAAAIVGNEYHLRREVERRADPEHFPTENDIPYLLDRIATVKRALAGTGVPVTTCEVDSFMFSFHGGDERPEAEALPAYRPVFDALDQVCVHFYPSWEQRPVDGAARLVMARYRAIERWVARTYGTAANPAGKPVLIGETGWPSGGAGGRLGGAVLDRPTQRRFLCELLGEADAADADLLYFTAFDELWKRREGDGIGQNWGYGYTDRAAKHDFAGVLLPSLCAVPVMATTGDRGAGDAAAAPQAPAAPALRRQVFLPIVRRDPSGCGLPFDARTVYDEWPPLVDTFVPSGLMGDIGNVRMFECDRSRPQSGELAIRADFDPSGEQGWGGVYWQYPDGNWGTDPTRVGMDLSCARRLSFWVRGARGGEVVTFKVGGIQGEQVKSPDTLRPARSTLPIALGRAWQRVEIDLAGGDLRQIAGGFAWVASRCDNAGPITFYLDDIRFDDRPAGTPASDGLARRPFYVYRDNNACDNHFAPSVHVGAPGAIRLDPAWRADANRADTAVQVTFTPPSGGIVTWAGVHWTEPDKNLGRVDGAGFDLSEATQLTFRARGALGGERFKFVVGGIGSGADRFPDSLRPPAGGDWTVLEREWRTYTINLAGRDLTRVIGGFGLSTDRCASPGGATIYLDDIRFEHGPPLPPPVTPRPFWVYKDVADPANHFTPTLWMGDAAVPGRVTLDECWPDESGTGTVIRVGYPTARSWAGVYWVYPPETVGDRPGGYDLRGATRVRFRVKGEGSLEGAWVRFLVGGVGYAADGNVILCHKPVGPFPDSICPPLNRRVYLTDNWQRVEIPLNGAPRPNLRAVVGGFGWATDHPVTFLLDDVVFEFD